MHVFQKKSLKEFAFENLLLLAPAVNFKTFQEITKRKQRVKRIRIFTMREEDEMKDALLKDVGKGELKEFLTNLYPCSILYAVSGLADDQSDSDVPLLGLERHLNPEKYQKITDKIESIQKVHELLPKLLQPSIRVQPIVESVHNTLANWNTDNSRSVVYSKTFTHQALAEVNAQQGLCTQAFRHGDFDNDEMTAKSIAALVMETFS
jgi:hypothetical protein